MMKVQRKVRVSEKILLVGLSFILLFMLIHDWVPLGPLNDVQAVMDTRSFQELITITLFGAGQILLLMGIVVWFMGKKYPLWAKLWLIIHQGFILSGAMLDWWIPYFTGYGAEERVERYSAMFGDTHAFLPVMNGIIPNTIHVLFHATLALCLLVTIYISLTDSRVRIRFTKETEPDVMPNT